MLNIEDLQNILTLIARANITGQEAISVATLQQKITNEIKEKKEVKK